MENAMGPGRRLTLRKEALTELTPAELVAVAGAAVTQPCPYSAPQCLTREISAVLANCPFG
jgi:hypothetical protein